jgi:hypothetical protein
MRGLAQAHQTKVRVLTCERPAGRHGVHARLAQLDRAPDYESGGQAFESLTARHKLLSDFLPKSPWERWESG